MINLTITEAKKNFMDMQDGDVVSTYADTKLSIGIEQFVTWYKEFYK